MNKLLLVAAMFVVGFRSSARAQEVVASDGMAHDWYGKAVSIYGDVALVGAPRHDAGRGDWSGAAYILRRSGQSWVEEAKLVPIDAKPLDFFGTSLSIFDDTAVVSATQAGTNTVAGAVYVFRKNGTSWVQEAKLMSEAKEVADGFGFSVSTNGDRIAVGALNEHGGAGAVYVYARAGNRWFCEETITAARPGAFESFGRSISLQGDALLIGAPGTSTQGYQSGIAYLFDRSAGNWRQKVEFRAEDVQEGDLFGSSVSMDGSYLAIGAEGSDAFGKDAGAVYIFSRSGEDAWILNAKLASPEPHDKVRFGGVMSLSGRLLLVTQSSRPRAGIQGRVWVFRLSRNGWAIDDEISAPSFEMTGSVFQGQVMIGTPHIVTGRGQNSGAVQILETDR